MGHLHGLYVKGIFIYMFLHICCREEELQLQKRKKRKIKGNSRLSFSDDFEDRSEEEDGSNGERFRK